MLSNAPRFTLTILGGASIGGPDGPLNGRASQRHRLALLALLAASPRGVTRDKAVALLWPEREPQRGRHALSDSIYRINDALGREAVMAGGNRDLWLDDDVLSCDLVSFRRAMDEERWQCAVDEYAGPFLDGFHLSGAAEFERWVAGERRQLARRYAEALESLAEERAEAEDVVGAVETWRLRAALDRFDARVAMRLMEALAAQGNPAAAIRHARIHAQLLEQEFGTGPDPDVAAMAERIRNVPAMSRNENRAGGDSARPAGTVLERPATEPEAVPDSAGTRAGLGFRTGPGHHAGNRNTPAAPEVPPASVGRESRKRTRTTISIAAGIAVVAVALAGLRVAGLISFPTSTRFGDFTAAASVLPEATAVTDTPSIAVLPFEDLSGDGDQVRFADGVAEEITNALERTDGLRVLARRSSFAFRDRPLDVRRIAELLGVDYIVDGSYRESADSVWISAHLIDGGSGFAIWSMTVPTRPSSERLYSTQNEIASRVAAELSLRFRAGSDPAYAAPGDDTYDAYLEGLFSLRLFQSGDANPDTILGAIDRLRRVTEELPGWAPGWAALGEAHHWAAYDDIEPRKHRLASKRALEEALTLDPDHAQANASYGYVLHRLDHDSEGAEAFLRRAVELDSEQYWHCGYPLFLLWQGRYDEAVRATRMAQVSDPVFWPLETMLAMAFRCAGQIEDAVRHAERALEQAAHAVYPYRELALALERSGRPEEALSTLDMAEAPNPYLDLVRALVLARNGRTGDAEALLRRTDTRRAEEWILDIWPARTMTAPPLHAAILVALGRPDDAIAELEEAVMRDPDTLLYDRCYRELQSLENDPRYRALLDRIGVRE